MQRSLECILKEIKSISGLLKKVFVHLYLMNGNLVKVDKEKYIIKI